MHPWITQQLAKERQRDFIARADRARLARESRHVHRRYAACGWGATASRAIWRRLWPGARGGEVKTARGDPDGALADWRHALDLNPENHASAYSSAFLLEREGRLAEAAEAWQYIVDYCDASGWELTAVWPREELQRLRGLLARKPDPCEEPQQTA